MKLNNKKGFTLIEILAAITIMGILSGTVIASISKHVNKSHKEFCSSQVKMLEIAGRSYFDDNMSLLPMNMGGEECVTLNQLVNEKYIEQLKDYSDTLCNVNASKVCSTKHLKSGYYYTTYLKCNKCNTDNANNKTDSTPIVRFTPASGQNTPNKDFTITMKITDSSNPIASYAYTVYQKTSSGDIPVETVDFREYKGDVKIKLNRKGTYYIKGYAYNSIGKLGEGRGGDYILKYSLPNDCGSQIEVTAKKKEDNSKINQRTWMKGTLEITIKKKGDIESYDIYVSKNDGPFQKVISKASALSRTITYDNKQTGIYRLKIVGYNDQGDTCSTDANGNYFEYRQDNDPPDCRTTGTPNGWDKGWVNKDVRLQANCEGEHPKYESQCNHSKSTSNLITAEINDYRSAGFVMDNVGNKTDCAPVLVRIDKTPPTCSITLNGTEGNNGYYRSDVTGRINTNDPLSNNVASGVATYDITTSSSPTYNNNSTNTYSNNTNNYVRMYGYVKDQAGNINSCTSKEFRVDKTPPTYNYTFNPLIPIGSGYDYGTTIQVKCSDVGSGPIRDFSQPFSYGMLSASISGQCEDLAGNTSPYFSRYFRYCPGIPCGYKSCEAPSPSLCGYQKCWHEEECQPDITYVPTDPDEGDGDDYDPPSPPADDSSLQCPTVSANVSAETWTNKDVRLNLNFGSGNSATTYKLYYAKVGTTNYILQGDHGVSMTSQTLMVKSHLQDGKYKIKIVVKNAKGETRDCTDYDRYYIDITPPKLTTVCRFNFDEASRYKNGFECQGDPESHVFNGVFVRIEDAHSKLGNSNYTVTGMMSNGQKNSLSHSRSGSDKFDAYCLKTLKGYSTRNVSLSYSLCDVLGNCTGQKSQSFSSDMGDFNGKSCTQKKNENAY